MPRYILYFTEYSFIANDGKSYSPYMEDGKWHIPGTDTPTSLTEVGHLCNIDEQELNFLKLKYGDKHDTMG